MFMFRPLSDRCEKDSFLRQQPRACAVNHARAENVSQQRLRVCMFVRILIASGVRYLNCSTDLFATYLGLFGLRIGDLQRLVGRDPPRPPVRVHVGVHPGGTPLCAATVPAPPSRLAAAARTARRRHWCRDQPQQPDNKQKKTINIDLQN